MRFVPRLLPRPSSAIHLLIAAAVLPLSAGAANFSIDGASNTARTLEDGEQGSIGPNGALSVGGGTVAVTIKGNKATLNNQGTIRQTGSGRVVRDNTGVSQLVIINGSATNAGALMQSADADVIQMAKGSSVTLDNYGTLSSLNASAGGAQAVDFASINGGANTVNNHLGAIIRANEADAVRTGVNGTVNNWGTILALTATGDSSDGVDAQENSGAAITNAGAITGGRHGITGGQSKASAAFSMTIINNAGASILGSDGSGVNLDGFNNKQVLHVTNAGTISGNGISGDGDGLDVDGIVHLVNSGTIRSVNAFSPAGEPAAHSEGISMGGGSVVNSGVIEGLSQGAARGRGITLAGNDITSGPLAGTREGLYGNASITNLSGGVIRGQNDAAIVAVGAASGYTVSIDNRAGAVIRGGSASGAAIQGGADATTIVNAGLIDGASSGKAIALGAGDNRVVIKGGSIVGDIDGGSGANNQLVVDLGAGGTFAYAHGLSNFSTVQVLSGHTVLSGVSAYAGVTQLSGGVLTLDGAQRLSSAGALLLDGGTLQLTNAGAAGQSFASLALGADSAVLLGGSALTFGALGSIVDGATLSFTQAAPGAYAFRVLGDLSQDAAFMMLLGATSIDGLAARYSFDGSYTSVSAVPEAGTWGMLLVGLGLMGWMRRRARS